MNTVRRLNCVPETGSLKLSKLSGLLWATDPGIY